jgi:hypothetical protein
MVLDDRSWALMIQKLMNLKVLVFDGIDVDNEYIMDDP